MTAKKIVIVDLQNPREKYWGALVKLTPAGIWLRGLKLDGFDDWLAQAADEASIPIGSYFFPMLRVERILVDESNSSVESYADIFERKTGHSAAGFLEGEGSNKPLGTRGKANKE